MADDYLPVQEELPTDAKMLEPGLLPTAIVRLETIVSSLEKIVANIESVGDAKEGMNSAQAAMRETNIKISILADSLAEKLSEFQPGSIAGIEKGMHATADLIREFMDYARERDAKIDNKLADIKVDEKLDNLKSSLEAISKNTSDNLEQIKVVMDAAARTAETMKTSADALDGLLQKAADFVSAQASAASELKVTAESSKETIAALKSLQEKLEETTKAVDRRTDDILNVMLSKTSELDRIAASLNTNAVEIQSSSSKLLAAANKLASLPVR